MYRDNNVNVFYRHQYCDKCGAELQCDSSWGVLIGSQPQYSHTCPQCGEKYTFDRIYPAVVFEEVIDYGSQG